MAAFFFIFFMIFDDTLHCPSLHDFLCLRMVYALLDGRRFWFRWLGFFFITAAGS